MCGSLNEKNVKKEEKLDFTSYHVKGESNMLYSLALLKFWIIIP